MSTWLGRVATKAMQSAMSGLALGGLEGCCRNATSRRTSCRLRGRRYPRMTDLDRDEFHVQSSGLGKSSQVVRVGCQDLVAIARQAHDRSVDRIGPTALPQKHSRSPAEADVQSFDFDSGKKPCEYGLAPRPTAPNLCNDPPMRERCPLG